jgi:hypothetical protein
VRDGYNHEPMLINVNTQAFLSEAAKTATDWSCRQSFNTKRPVGYVRALAGRCAR